VDPNPTDVVLAIDQGTTNSKAALVGADGTIAAIGSAGVAVDNPRPGWVEQDPEQIWRSVPEAVAEALSAAGDVRVVGVALSTQRESVLIWQRSTGRALGPLLGWQDRRTASWCTSLLSSDDPAAASVSTRTGLRIDPMFSAPKLRWLLDHRPVDAAIDDVCAGTVDAWLVWRLTGGRVHATDAGNASRTLLYDVTKLAWSKELCGLFGVPVSVLPDSRPSNAGFGETAGLAGIQDGTPLIAVLADSHAALFGQGGDSPGLVKATYGTGTSVMTPVSGYRADFSTVPLTLAWLTDAPVYAREGNILSSGAALAWTATLLGLGSVGDLLRLAESVPDAGGVQLLPAFTGLGAPYWDRSVRAGLSGMTQATTPAHVARAAVDAVAQQICDVVDVIVADGTSLAVLRADGGATASALLMQTQADLLGLTVEVADVPEVSAVGAAKLAWQVLDGGARWRRAAPARTYEPTIDPQLRAERRRGWRMNLDAARSQATDPP
jgi:glycerol kinase